MLEFKMANAATAATSSGSLAAYKAVPERSTSAISRGLSRLFSMSVSGALSRGGTAPSVSGQGEEWETITAGKRHKARELDSVHSELDEYLEEPLESFSRIERVNGIDRTVVFDVLTYWQVCATLSFLLRVTNFNTDYGEKISKSFPSRNGHPTCTSKFGAMRTSLLIREGDLYRSPEQNPTETHGGPTSLKILFSKRLAQLDRALISWILSPGG